MSGFVIGMRDRIVISHHHRLPLPVCFLTRSLMFFTNSPASVLHFSILPLSKASDQEEKKKKKRKKKGRKIREEKNIPAEPINVNSCAPLCVFCGLYSSVKTYRCKSAKWTTRGLSRESHVGERI